ncbi:DUF2254 domain-containing protein [Nostocoides sp. Soil756]|uniref:DUF2254 domain-containing protein n=1 Tax=Nostocoides sp. Soil756 TaxID=1736399 RepID=UPI0006F6921F|nr:DUF2254 domain-containing protein [Tetrasphaera sp. Soil756]KRE61320.1 hypothetical protein ASG78_13455 [Tetrasphaera sp. Soil756]
MSSRDESARGAIRRTVGPVGDPDSIGWWQALWSPFWVLPSTITLTAVAAAAVLPVLDARVLGDVPFVFDGNVDSARSLLSTIASAMISVTGLVFSITMVVMQLASSQFTPRLLGTFLASRIVQVTLGVFTSSFVFSLVVLRTISSGDSVGVPQVSVTVAFLLVLASVALFFAFIQHITQSIQVVKVIDRVARATVRVLSAGSEQEWAEGGAGAPTWSQAAGPRVVVTTGTGHGCVQRIHYSHLVECAERAGVVIELLTRVGAVRHQGQELALVHGAVADDPVVHAVRAAIGLGRERSMPQDPEFGVRQLVDIAERALSPSVNDPTTAVQVLDELHRVLRVAAAQPDRSPHLVDAQGVVRVLDRPTRFAGLLDLALDEIAHYGADDLQVPARIEGLLADLAGMARPEHAATVEQKAAALRARHGGRHADAD